MNIPHKYIFITAYKINVNKEETMLCFFFKYTGVYFIMCEIDGMRIWKFFNNRETCYKCIHLLKQHYYAKKIHIPSYKKYNIDLSPAGSCFFNCQLCDYNLYLRNLIWEEDNDWLKCETDGIYLTSSRSVEYSEEYPSCTCDLFKLSYIENNKQFIEFTMKSILSSSGNCTFFCDNCYANCSCGCSDPENNARDKTCLRDKTYFYDNIYFCKCCDEKYVNNKEPGDDRYNLCHLCCTPENINNHVLENPGHTEFILKPTIKFPFVR
jgi:hypothetical protein